MRHWAPPVVVENVQGAGGNTVAGRNIGTDRIAKAIACGLDAFSRIAALLV